MASTFFINFSLPTISADWLNDVNAVVYGPTSPAGTLRAQLVAPDGASRVGFQQNGSNTVARTVESKLQEADSGLDYTTLILAGASGKSIDLVDNTYTVTAGVVLTLPAYFGGNGHNSGIVAGGGFTPGYLLTLSPNVGQDPKAWIVENLTLTANASVNSPVLLNIATAGKFISKLTFRNVISHVAVPSNIFFELLNSIPNVDGFFTSVVEDNWSFGGYFLDNAGDSLIFQRNTTTGEGRAYYVNQLPGASHIIIRDGNSTSAGGILIANSWNLSYDNMQTEISGTYTGTGTGVFTVQNGGAAENVNVRLTNSNINTNGGTNTTLACAYFANSQNAFIQGNTLLTNGTTGAHVVLAATARNTYIGSSNTYFNNSGVEVTPIISDAGVGTKGVWKVASEATWTTGELSFFKDIDDFVHLRGNLSGSSSTGGQVITTFPVGHRPGTAQTLVVAYGGVIGTIGISIAGVLTLQVASQTSVFFDGVTFSTKP